MDKLKRVPPIVWLAILTAVIIGLKELIRDHRREVIVLGSGLLTHLVEADAPEGIRFDLRVVPEETAEQLTGRIAAVAAEWPDVVMVGWGGNTVGSARDGFQDTIEAQTKILENTAAVPVVVGPPFAEGSTDEHREINRWWTTVFCRRKGFRMCVDLSSHRADAAAVRKALARAAQDGVSRRDAWTASTQRGR